MQYVLTLSGREESFDDGHAAGAAYARADISLRPSVAIRSAGLATTIAQARPAGMYEDGTLRIVKSMPRNSAPGARDFAGGYFQQLSKQLREQLAIVDWRLAKPAMAFQVPKLSGSVYDDFEALAKHDFPGAVKLWSSHCPREFEPPAFLNPAFRAQTAELSAVSKALNTLQDSRAPQEAQMNAARSIVESIAGNAIADPAIRERLAKAMAGQVTARMAVSPVQLHEKAVPGRSR